MILGSGGVEVRGMHPPGDRKLQEGDLVTTELTPAVEGYYVQLCRTLVVGEPSDAQVKAHDVYIEAADAGEAILKTGVTAAAVARAENDVFRSHGLGLYCTAEYTRVRGHGLGLFPDSKPHLLEDVEVPLPRGAAVIVHPNTYHPEVGYIVFGDTLIVKDDGFERLMKTPRALLSVPA
jgi:Xaa-Pro aminopeptidase